MNDWGRATQHFLVHLPSYEPVGEPSVRLNYPLSSSGLTPRISSDRPQDNSAFLGVPCLPSWRPLPPPSPPEKNASQDPSLMDCVFLTEGLDA